MTSRPGGAGLCEAGLGEAGYCRVRLGLAGEAWKQGVDREVCALWFIVFYFRYRTAGLGTARSGGAAAWFGQARHGRRAWIERFTPFGLSDVRSIARLG